MSLTVFCLGLENIRLIRLIRLIGFDWSETHGYAPAGLVMRRVAHIKAQATDHAPFMSSEPPSEVPAVEATTRRRYVGHSFNKCGLGLGLAKVTSIHQLGYLAHPDHAIAV